MRGRPGSALPYARQSLPPNRNPLAPTDTDKQVSQRRAPHDQLGPGADSIWQQLLGHDSGYASISKVVLIRTGATTHFFDQNTRYVPLAFQQTTGGLTVTGPVDGNLAPPGYYMLFLVNGSGVPSVASIVQVP